MIDRMCRALLPVVFLLPITVAVPAQEAPAVATAAWTTADDHRQMQQQLGITKLRPGRNANEGQPNQANYDEAQANPYPDLPEVLTLTNGKKVTSARQWREQRRPELIELFEREMYGRVPKQVPKVDWSVQEATTAKLGERQVNARRLQGRVDNSSYPAIDVNIELMVVTPADAKGPVPLMIMFGRGRMPGAPPPAAGSPRPLP